MKGNWGGKGKKKLTPGTVIKLGTGVGRGQARRAELLTDSSYAAFLRQYKSSRDSVKSTFQALKDQQDDVDLPRFVVNNDRVTDRNLGDINEESDSRGMFRSGERERDRATEEGDSTMRYTNFTGDQSSELERARREKANVLAGMRLSRAEERVDARSRITDREATTQYGL
tara:strand:+ start:484 stop:996 length:513 start_codon:yes stop_codon:yes gene_type:complete